jgi:hypothetical protein
MQQQNVKCFWDDFHSISGFCDGLTLSSSLCETLDYAIRGKS